jgi:hypothetical protein
MRSVDPTVERNVLGIEFNQRNNNLTPRLGKELRSSAPVSVPSKERSQRGQHRTDDARY